MCDGRVPSMYVDWDQRRGFKFPRGQDSFFQWCSMTKKCYEYKYSLYSSPITHTCFNCKENKKNTSKKYSIWETKGFTNTMPIERQSTAANIPVQEMFIGSLFQITLHLRNKHCIWENCTRRPAKYQKTIWEPKTSAKENKLSVV